MSDQGVFALSATEGFLTDFPQGRSVGPGGAAYALLTEVWSQRELPYDWNPNCAWYRNGTGDFVVMRIGGFLVMTFPSPISSGSVSLLWGRGTRADLDDLLELDILSFRSDVETGSHIETLKHPAPLTMIRSRDFDDYIIDLKDQLALKGKRFSNRRNRLRSLERNYRSVEILPLDLASTRAKADIWRIYDRWASERDDSPTIAAERRALARSLDGRSESRLQCIGLDIEGELRGFAIYDVFGNISTLHIMKADRDSAITAGMMHGLFTAAHGLGATSINIGYDGGLKGLREAKRGLIPQKMLRTVWLTH